MNLQTKHIRVYVSAQKGYSFEYFRITYRHTINTFKTKKYLRILTLNIYLKRITHVYKGI